MASFSFELVSPERLLVSEQVDQVTVPGIEGEFTVLDGHAPFVTILRPGVITVRAGGTASRHYVRGGFAEVNPTGLTILADLALPIEELTAERFVMELEVAQAAVRHAHSEDARRRAQERVDWLNDLRASLGTRTAAH